MRLFCFRRGLFVSGAAPLFPVRPFSPRLSLWEAVLPRLPVVREPWSGPAFGDNATTWREPRRLGVCGGAAAAGMRQLLEFGLFHGDPHPGNIFAMRDGRIAYVDFGNVAQLSQRNKEARGSARLPQRPGGATRAEIHARSHSHTAGWAPLRSSAVELLHA